MIVGPLKINQTSNAKNKLMKLVNMRVIAGSPVTVAA